MLLGTLGFFPDLWSHSVVSVASLSASVFLNSCSYDVVLQWETGGISSWVGLYFAGCLFSFSYVCIVTMPFLSSWLVLQWLSLDVLFVLMHDGSFLVWEARLGWSFVPPVLEYLGLFWDFVKSYLPEFTLPSWKRIILFGLYFFSSSCIPGVFTFKESVLVFSLPRLLVSPQPLCLSPTHLTIKKPPPLASLKIWGVLMRILRVLLTYPDNFHVLEEGWRTGFYSLLCFRNLFLFLIISIWSLLC